MAVENTNTPGPPMLTNPEKGPAKVPDDVVALSSEVQKARFRRELAQENQLTDSIVNPRPVDQPFQIRGGVDLGTIDVQQQQREAREAEAVARKEAQERLDKTQLVLDQTKDQLHNTQLDMVRQGLEAQIKILADAMAKGQSAQQPNFESQLAFVEALAGKLGYTKEKPVTSDFNLQIELKRLEAEIERENRKFELAMKQDERNWQLELKKLDTLNREAELKRQADERRWQQFAQLPDQVGQAIAKGILNRGNGEVVDNSPYPDQSFSSPNPSSPPISTQNPVVDAIEGQIAEFDCDACGTVVGIGPSAGNAVCSNCGRYFNVNRISNTSPTPAWTPP